MVAHTHVQQRSRSTGQELSALSMPECTRTDHHLLNRRRIRDIEFHNLRPTGAR